MGLNLPFLSTISTSALTVRNLSFFQTGEDKGGDVYTIYTNYDPNLHKTPCFSAYEDNNSKMLALTEGERVKAEGAVMAASLVDFKYQVFLYSAIQF